jgi:hypothetical protein
MFSQRVIGFFQKRPQGMAEVIKRPKIKSAIGFGLAIRPASGPYRGPTTYEPRAMSAPRKSAGCAKAP